MMIEQGRAGAVGAALTLALDEGIAERMGDGLFVVCQMVDGALYQVVLSTEDLQRMLEAG